MVESAPRWLSERLSLDAEENQCSSLAETTSARAGWTGHRPCSLEGLTLVAEATTTAPMATPPLEGIEALRDLGFTEMEAQVYVALLQGAPATAYRIAQQVGKAAANVYKAVESLQNKGAVLVDEAESSLYRPVALADLLRHVEARFKTARDRASRALERVERQSGDERVYQLRSREQVLERARSLLRRSTKMVLCDLFPGPAEELREELESAARRGCRVFLQAYQPIAFSKSIALFVKPNGTRHLGTWPGEWLNLVGDAQEHLLALLRTSDGGVHCALWGESKYLSVIFHSGIKCEMAWGAIDDAMSRNAAPEDVRREYERVRELVDDMRLPGYVALLDQFGVGAASSLDSRAVPAKKGAARRAPTRRTPG